MVEDKYTDEILQKLKRKRERILLALYRHGELRSREIRSQTDIPRGSKDHHYGLLQDWGLIEVIGRDTEAGGNPERIFDLTDTGRGFVEEYLADTEEHPDSYELRVERLEDEVDDLQTVNERLEAQIADLKESTVTKTEFNTFVDQLEEELF